MSVAVLEVRPETEAVGRGKARVRSSDSAPLEPGTCVTLPRFDAGTARSLGEIVVNIGSRRGSPIAVSVARGGGLLYYCALEGSCTDNARSVRRKQNTVLLFGKSSLEVGMTFAQEGWTLASRGMSSDDYTLSGGGVPLYVANAGLVGALAVSGMGGAADHELALEALCWHLGMSPIGNLPRR